VVMSYINPDVEYAYKTSYPFDPVEYVREHRVKIVMAVFTLLRAYVLAEDKVVPGPLANFDLWWWFVRGAIVWAGGADPVLSQQGIVDEDEDRLEIAKVMAGWGKAMGNGDFYALKDVVEKANDHYYNHNDIEYDNPLLHEALEEIEVYEKKGHLSAKRFGHWLKSHENEIIDGAKFVKRYNSDRKSYDWALKS